MNSYCQPCQHQLKCFISVHLTKDVMNVLTTSLFLCGVLLTQTKAGTLNQDLSVSPLSEPLYMFDVISDAGADAVKGALSGMEVRRSFKVL